MKERGIVTKIQIAKETLSAAKITANLMSALTGPFLGKTTTVAKRSK
jgi:hypothetical protein